MNIDVEETPIRDVKVITCQAFSDDRGYFMEVFRRDLFQEAGLPTDFVQFNHSRSRRGVIRGLHFQWDPPMGKLMRVTSGRAFLVGVDIRPDSPTLGKSFGLTLSPADQKQVWAPASVARGFCALEDDTEVQYLCTGTYNSSGESGIRFDDPELDIAWPVANPVVSDKDRAAQTLREWLARPEASAFRS